MHCITELKKQVLPRFLIPYVTLFTVGLSTTISSAALSDIYWIPLTPSTLGAFGASF
jgi:hypothetical protein